MKIYWSTRSVPELQAFKATDRALIIQLAARSMPLPRRFFTKTLQLLVLIALFWQLLSVESWLWRILALLAAGLFYPLLLHPLRLNLTRPYLAEAAREYSAMQEQEQDSAE